MIFKRYLEFPVQSRNVNIDQESNKKERETYSLDHINSQDLHSERESLSYLLPTKKKGGGS